MENRFPRDMYIKIAKSGHIVSINFCCDFMSKYFIDKKVVLKNYFREKMLLIPEYNINVKYCPHCGGRVWIDKDIPWE